MNDWSRPPGYSDDDPSKDRATFAVRLGAFVIDGVLLTAVFYLGALALGYNLLEDKAEFPDQSRFGPKVMWQWIGVVSLVLYYAILEGGSGQTIGKKLMKIRVVDFYRGDSIGFWRALWRLVAHIPSNFVCYLGYLWMLWDPEEQTWHDKLAGTVVVPSDVTEPQSAGAT